MLFQVYGDNAIYQWIGWILVFCCLIGANELARRTKRVMLQAVIAGLVLATIGMIAAAFNLIPVVVGAFLQEAIDVVSILWALTALIDRD